MKAVIVEINGEYASVLSDDGCFSTIKNHGYETGQVIWLGQPKINIAKKLTMLTASAAAVLILGIGTWAYASPYSYVSLDVNPSIEYIVNRFDRVLRVNAVNDDGEEILKEINLKGLKNRSILDALTKTVEQIQEAGYFNDQEEGGIIIATSGHNPDKAAELAVELQSAVEEEVVENNNITVETFSVTKERVDEAREFGVTPGKLNLVEKLQESASGEDNINLEEWLNKPVKDIVKATNSYSKSTASKEKEDTEAATGTDSQSSGKKDKADKNQSKRDKEEANSDHNNGKGKDKSDQNPGNGKDKPGQNPGNGKDKTDQNSGNSKDKTDQNPGNSKDKTDQNPGNSKDKSNKDFDNSKDNSDKNSGNSKDKPDKSFDNSKDNSDKNSGKGKDNSDHDSGNSHNKPDKGSGNGQKKPDKEKGNDKPGKGSVGNKK